MLVIKSLKRVGSILKRVSYPIKFVNVLFQIVATTKLFDSVGYKCERMDYECVRLPGQSVGPRAKPVALNPNGVSGETQCDNLGSQCVSLGAGPVGRRGEAGADQNKTLEPGAA
jgi:hypothetical protein